MMNVADPVDADLVVGHVREEYLHFADRTIPPVAELLVKLPHRPRDLVGRDVDVAEFGFGNESIHPPFEWVEGPVPRISSFLKEFLPF